MMKIENHGAPDEGPEDHNTSFLSVLNTYYDDEADDYSDVPLIEPNPDYQGPEYLQDRADPA